jgi:hypothetical protein
MGGKEVEIRSALEVDIDQNIFSAPYSETSITEQEMKFSSAIYNRKWVLKLNNDCSVWEWPKKEKDIKSSSIYALYEYIKNGYIYQKEEVNKIPPQFTGHIIPDKSLDKDDPSSGPIKIVPVIYQPAVDSLANFVREIHCAYKPSTDFKEIDTEVSLLFNNDELLKNKRLSRIYGKIRLFLYGRTIDVETFRIHSKNITPNTYDIRFLFEGIYSGQFGIEHDTIHLDKAPAPRRSVGSYFIDQFHPVVYINCANHAMAEVDNNHSLWKWEYVPWENNAPIVFGKKSRSEIDRQYMPIFQRLRSHRGRIRLPIRPWRTY